MTISSLGTVGAAGSGVSGTTLVVTTGVTLQARDTILLVVCCQNATASDGENRGEVLSVSGGAGEWSRLGEYTNANGAANAGLTTSVWRFIASGAVASGTSITISLATAVSDKAASAWAFRPSVGTLVADALRLTETDDSADFGSMAFAGIGTKERLWFAAHGKRAQTGTQITPSTGFTAITVSGSRNDPAAVQVRGEWRIATSASETSDPDLAVVGDTASLFFAIGEYGVGPKSRASSSTLGGDSTAACWLSG